MAEEKKTEKEALKDSTAAKWLKGLLGGGAMIGASTVITALLKQGNYESVKGFKKLLIPLGIFGVASAASHAVEKAVHKKVDDYCDTMEGLKEVLFFLSNHNVKDITLEPEEDGIRVDITGSNKEE